MNVRKHAEASRVEVVLRPEAGGAQVLVRDDGVGFSSTTQNEVASATHFGMGSMRERAEMAGGWWRVQSAPGEGTSVEFWLPREAASPTHRSFGPPAGKQPASASERT